MGAGGGGNKIVQYLLVTALMVITFICAIAISRQIQATVAWFVLLGLNLGALLLISRL